VSAGPRAAEERHCSSTTERSHRTSASERKCEATTKGLLLKAKKMSQIPLAHETIYPKIGSITITIAKKQQQRTQPKKMYAKCSGFLAFCHGNVQQRYQNCILKGKLSFILPVLQAQNHETAWFDSLKSG
jgi:hypothetical protein